MPAGTVTRCLIAFAVAAAAAPVAIAADDPLPRIVAPKDGASICYQRLYDAAHLRRNPRQQTTAALLSFKYEGADGGHIERIILTRRDRQPVLYIAGSCVWSETANIDTSGRRMIRSFVKNAGYGCIALTGPGSAEEGGVLMIDLAADGKALTLHLDSPIYAMRGEDKRGVGEYVKLGLEDRVFRLTRTDAAACRALEENLPDLP
ncbi:MAG: hypothetical protein Q8M24_06690 [Pseudolabrys sp.]|nr:hypothetical protein [Pseudolabrys sp.]MDP2295136.1 hypothetical protein [Pseudolabrys sp.]